MIAANHKSTVPDSASDGGRAGADFSMARPWRNRRSRGSENPEAASATLPAGDGCAKVSCGNRLYDELWAGTPLAFAGSASGECSTSVTPRMSASIFVAMPAFSFRNRLACSRPCPRRVSSKK